MTTHSLVTIEQHDEVDIIDPDRVELPNQTTRVIAVSQPTEILVVVDVESDPTRTDADVSQEISRRREALLAIHRKEVEVLDMTQRLLRKRFSLVSSAAELGNRRECLALVKQIERLNREVHCLRQSEENSFLEFLRPAEIGYTPQRLFPGSLPSNPGGGGNLGRNKRSTFNCLADFRSSKDSLASKFRRAVVAAGVSGKFRRVAENRRRQKKIPKISANKLSDIQTDRSEEAKKVSASASRRLYKIRFQLSQLLRVKPRSSEQSRRIRELRSELYSLTRS